MDRREFLGGIAVVIGGGMGCLGLSGCRGHQYGHVLEADQKDMVGSHSAGSETFNPLIDEAVAQLLGRHGTPYQSASFAPGQTGPGPIAVCFVGVENKSAEELGDFKDQIYQQIDTRIVQSGGFRAISKRFVDAGLQQTRLRPDSLFIPSNMQTFAAVMEQMGQPFDYLLYATITSGTTENNHSYQRDYLLTLELVNVRTGEFDKQSAQVRKGYHRTSLGAVKNYNPFKSADH
jgi:hypothetical protein